MLHLNVEEAQHQIQKTNSSIHGCIRQQQKAVFAWLYQETAKEKLPTKDSRIQQGFTSKLSA
jgi:hypothetical protein